jgi:hypothetical protein
MPQDAPIPRRSFLALAAAALAMVRPRAAVPEVKSPPCPILPDSNGKSFDPTTHTHYFGPTGDSIVILSRVRWKVRPAG